MSKIYGSPLFLSGSGGGVNKDLPPLLDNFKAVAGEEENAILVSADKMEESRANELAGAVWVYADHEPTSVNDGTKIQLSREEIITDRKPEPEPITLADIPVSDAETETVVNLKESDGLLHPYIYLSRVYQQDGYCLMLRQDIHSVHNQSETNRWGLSKLRTYCNETFLNTLPFRDQLLQVEIDGESDSMSQDKVFVLSCTELAAPGFDWEQLGMPISYFNSNQRRIAYFGGDASDYWTRDTVTSNPYYIKTDGTCAASPWGANRDCGLRPAFVLPITFKIKATPNLDGSYDMYEDSSAASTFASSEFTVEKQVSWENTKDFYARQFTYNSKKQYQTMLEGAIATLNDVPEGQPITELESGSKVKLGVWNDTPLQWKVARDTSDQSIRLVLEPTSVSLLGNMAYDAAEPSNSDISRRSFGNNRYIYSNIHQWLNATKATGWYTAQHSADAAPAYASSAGFLSGWSENHIAALDKATLTTSRSNADGGGTETFVARVALISTTELGLQSNTGGGRLDIFNSDGDRATGSLYWTRTPNPSYLAYAYRVMGTGGLDGGNLYVSTASGVRPLCIPLSTTLVSLEMDDDNCYTITGVNE